jgi:U11/U12 small nuclear ribonucleoprotein SNRNP25
MDSAGAAKPEEVAAYQSSEAKQARLQSMLAALLDDPVLADVPRKPSLGDVDTLISLELGSAMRVTVVKLDNSSFGMLSSPNPTSSSESILCHVLTHLDSLHAW